MISDYFIDKLINVCIYVYIYVYMYVCNLAEDIAPAHPACHCGLLGQSRYAPLTGSSEPVPTHTYIHTYILTVHINAGVSWLGKVCGCRPSAAHGRPAIHRAHGLQASSHLKCIHTRTYIHTWI